MKAIHKITIKGQEREAIFTLRLFSYASANNIKIEIPTAEGLKADPMAWVEPYINIIYTGLLAGCDRAGIEPDFDRYDVEVWATENQQEFVKVVKDIILLFTAGNKGQETEGEQSADESPAGVKKKSWKSIFTRLRVS